jgi:hypothetical protein
MASRMFRASTRLSGMVAPDPGHPRKGAIIRAARGCVGARFRLQGRGPDGLDCLGLVLACGRAAGLRLSAPAEYLMRGHDIGRIERELHNQGFRELPMHVATGGDLLLAVLSRAQAHFAVRTERGVVEAHAGLRRVVERPIGHECLGSRAWRFPIGDA